jgi:hypothetical protein
MIVCLPILFVMLIKIIKKKFVSFQNFLGFVPISFLVYKIIRHFTLVVAMKTNHDN